MLIHRGICVALAAWMTCAALAVAGETTPAGVSVKPHPPKVTTRTFNPKNHPPEMPPLEGNEAAVTESKFACGVQVGVEITQRGRDKPRMKVTDVNADLQLDIVVWLPTNVTAKIRAHEEGHREIAEHFYADSEAIARKIARTYVGREIDIDSGDPEHTRPIIQKLANEFCGEYLGATQVLGSAAQQRYDELTDHGRNRMSEKEAIRRAIAKK